MILFDGKRTSDFIESKKASVKCEIESLSDEQICNSSLEDLQEYFYEQFKVDLIEIEKDINYINIDAKKTRIQKFNSFYSPGSIYEDKFYYVDGYKIIYNIPFDGCVDLLFLRPSSYILTSFKVDNVIYPTDEKEGEILFSQEYDRELIDKKENMIEFATREFNSKFSNYFKMIEYVNADICNYNSSLQEIINTHLQIRLKKAEDYLKLREKLNIPLKLNENSPNIKPVRLKKVKKKKEMPLSKLKSSPVEYCISDDDYNNINRIINLSCVSMEKAARTFCKLQEEELRDVILASLNTHYLGTATGETFNKRGKTDIHIPFENKSAYIGECKIWTGKGLFREAITQLFSYMRWRDTKTSLIIFNKKNKDFSLILQTVDEILSIHELCIDRRKISKNEWECEFKKDIESTEKVKLNIAIYDLHIES